MSTTICKTIGMMLILSLAAGCGNPVVAPAPSTAMPAPPTVTAAPASVTPAAVTGKLLDDESKTLSSLTKVDNYPLYTMHYYGAYKQMSAQDSNGTVNATLPQGPPAWACSLFAALGDPANLLYGRNFDWQYSPALLLFTDPPDGYASVSMVDVAYLIEPGQARALTDLPLDERQPLLRAPHWPFDGMNEHGLVVGMAAVPPGSLRPDLNKKAIDSLEIIREILDRARNVDEAVAILQSYNIDMGGGPPLHYLIADRSGRAVLVEFTDKMIVMPNDAPWHAATNHWRATASKTGSSGCWRYDKVHERLTAAQGRLAAKEALELLSAVSQASASPTQWSIVYEFGAGDVRVVMGRQFDNAHTFRLDLAGKR